MRARRDKMRAGSDKAVAHRQYPLPAGRRSRLDDDKHVAGRFPEPLRQPADHDRRQLVQHIGNRDKVGRRQRGQAGLDVGVDP